MKHRQRDRIVFLDAASVDYGDISLREIERLGDFTAYPKTLPRQIRSRLRGATTAITNKCVFDAPLIASLDSLRAVHVTATGVNNVDLRAAARKGIAVTNVAGYSTETVVQFTVAFILALACRLVDYQREVKKGTWCKSPFFTLPAYRVSEVAGKTLSILGYGTIGRRVAQVARSLGMRVLAGRIPGRVYSKKDAAGRVSFIKALKEADFLTLHAPLSDLTRNLINEKTLRKMKPRACLINMARGGMVDEKALDRALRKGGLAGAATDVLTAEPPARDHVLLRAPNLLITPHIAWASFEARSRLVREVALNIKAFQQGRKRNRIV